MCRPKVFTNDNYLSSVIVTREEKLDSFIMSVHHTRDNLQLIDKIGHFVMYICKSSTSEVFV